MAQESSSDIVQCPVCLRDFKAADINSHLDNCLLQAEVNEQEPESESSGEPPRKKQCTAEPCPAMSSWGAKEGSGAPSTSVFSLFQKGKPGTTGASDAPGFFSSKRTTFEKSEEAGHFANNHKWGKRSAPGVDVSGDQLRSKPAQDGLATLGTQTREKLYDSKPLAEKMRPCTLDDYFGQNKVLGENTLLRSLLETQDIPSLMLWGPPGCGKTTLAHIIATNSKKSGNSRFVTLSATSTSTSEVREVIKQAQNELKLFKRKTILFIDEIHRFNKSQQDTFLPHVECGTITLIGATTENPSFQVNAALLSRCRVIVLEKLSVEAMESILARALDSLGIQVLEQEGDDSASIRDISGSSEPSIYIEQKALSTIAHLCDGDARAGLNGLQLAVQSRLSAARLGQLKQVIVQEDHIKEGLQRSHILYDKAGEEHYNCISALHKSMRGSDENAALYWLGRMLEGGEDPLYVARRLVRFASEDVGLADPMALTHAVAAFQGCHFIGMPECEVLLAQCAVYLARAPKSIEVYSAYNRVKECLKSHKGPLPPVPLHLRNAPTKLMKSLGYAKGYKYNPSFTEPVEQDYLPEEMKGTNFFQRKPNNF
uniref:ATPase WRNIP1 n=2 Tax=Erpetoichthys calabaricus TaxID=27687 RepID=A0A8C4RUZ7_ERPCA